jgi:hypothetical protein
VCDEAYYLDSQGKKGEGVFSSYVGVGAALGLACALTTLFAAPLLVWSVAGLPLMTIRQRKRARKNYLREIRKAGALPKSPAEEAARLPPGPE